MIDRVASEVKKKKASGISSSIFLSVLQQLVEDKMLVITSSCRDLPHTFPLFTSRKVLTYFPFTNTVALFPLHRCWKTSPYRLENISLSSCPFDCWVASGFFWGNFEPGHLQLKLRSSNLVISDVSLKCHGTETK